MSKRAARTILVLAANPHGTDRLRLGEEVKKIEQALERSKKRDSFRLVQKWAVTDDDLRRALLDHQPEFVHFSGHGAGKGGLAFESENGNLQLVSSTSLAELFRLCAHEVKCVVINACLSEDQARAISSHIDYVVGMKQEIGDDAAIKFSLGFYDALGAGRDTKDAYRFGCNAIDLKNIPEHLTPVLIDRVRPRHILSEHFDGSQQNDYASISFRAGDNYKEILIRTEAFRSIGGILDAIFIHYLANHVSPYSYGAQWILMTAKGYGNSRIAAPLAWVVAGGPIHTIDAKWYAQPPSSVGLVPRSSWKIIFRNSDKSTLLNLSLIGICTNSSELVADLLKNPKLYVLLARGSYLVAANSPQSYIRYKHQVVMTDWIKVAEEVGPILIDTEAPLTEDQKYMMGWW